MFQMGTRGLNRTCLFLQTEGIGAVLMMSTNNHLNYKSTPTKYTTILILEYSKNGTHAGSISLLACF